MKKLFTLAIALMSMFALLQPASALTYTVTVPVGTFECHIAGNFPAPLNWAPSAAESKMTKVDATHFTITYDNTDATMKYKYCSGPDWAYVEKKADGTDVSDRTYSAADVVEKWAAVFDPTVVVRPAFVTIDVLTSDSVQVLYLNGTFNKWAGPQDSTKMTISTPASGGVIAWTKTLWVPDANALQFNFCAGPAWDYAQSAPAGNFVFPVGTDVEMAVQVQYFKKIYDQTKAGTVHIKATVPSGTDKVWIVGSFSLPNWTFPTAIAGVKNLDGTFSFTVPNVIDFAYVCLNQLDWGHKEADPVDPTAAHADRTASYPTDANASITVTSWVAAPDAVQQINANNYKVYSTGSKIVVEGVLSQVDVFDLGGRNVQTQKLTGKFTSNSLNKGLYIIRVDGATQKVSVN